jgi:hypothetical protein
MTEQKGISLQDLSKCRDFQNLYNDPPISLVKILSNPHSFSLWPSVWTQGGTEQKKIFNVLYLTMLSQ